MSEGLFEDCNTEKRDCCVTNPPSFEIKALLIPCSVSYCPCNIPGQPSTSKTSGFECGSEETEGRLSNCTKKLIITVRMSHVGRTLCENQYVVVDHVYDPNSEHKQRLLYPYVLKISQKPIMQTYSLERESSVNEKSTEMVINKNHEHYKGCKTTGEDTTCHRLIHNNKPVPYSAGFCCSCTDDLKHQEPEDRQENLDTDEDDNDYEHREKIHAMKKRKASTKKTKSIATTQTAYKRGNLRNKLMRDQMLELWKTMDSLEVNDIETRRKGLEKVEKEDQSAESECTKKSKRNEPGEKEKVSSQVRALDEKVTEECTRIMKNLSETLGIDKKSGRKGRISTHPRRSHYPFIHPRGGQDCSNTSCPPNVDPETFHQSTHCLVFSDLWYTVYKMSKPVILHEVSVEIFEKHEDLMGRVIWHDVTKGKPLIVGTVKSEDVDQDEEVWIGYTGQEPSPHSFGLDPDIHRLLVPEPLESGSVLKYPELSGGPYEWLVVPNYMISYEGNKCDKIGVGFEAFVKQPNRCDMPRGSCLKNQPKDLWSHDHRLEEVGQSGSYFLKYFGFLPKCPILNSSEEDDRKNLTMYFRSAYVNTLNIEVKTDYNLVLRPNAAAVITEVYVDSTNYIKSTLTVKITNAGLIYGVFYVALTDCPLDMPASFSNIQTKPAVIQPQHQHVFVIEIMCPLPLKKFYCSIEAKNVKSELMAFRRIRFQKDDRCICIWHCVCTCLETDGGLQCQPLPFDHYNAAGFRGGLPMAADYVRFTLVEELMTVLCHLFLTMTLILIVMGVLKGVIGFFYKPIGEWGFCSVLGLPKPMKTYHENSLKGRRVVYDKYGWPVHPDTRRRVRNTSMVVEFCINTIFFVIYPLVMINEIVKRMCFVESTDESDKQLCCLCGQRHQAGQCPPLGILKEMVQFKRPIKEMKKCPGFYAKYTSKQNSSVNSDNCSCY